MEFRIKWVLVLFILVVMSIGGWKVIGQRQDSTQTQWEYTVKKIYSIDEVAEKFNELGGQSWELVNVTDDGFAYFKRPKK